MFTKMENKGSSWLGEDLTWEKFKWNYIYLDLAWEINPK